MDKKVFSGLAAVTIGTLAVSGLLLKPAVAFADNHEHAAAAHGEKGCSGKDGKHEGEKHCSGKEGEKHCAGNTEKSCSGKTEHKSEKSCSGEHGCSGKK
ncbi:MAG: hypothetical protein K1X79_00270 [Oligoflexia bacterium]|nr:hypothetical protein [Oligoflexia bacterium]